jgi:hypothetical protein
MVEQFPKLPKVSSINSSRERDEADLASGKWLWGDGSLPDHIARLRNPLLGDLGLQGHQAIEGRREY